MVYPQGKNKIGYMVPRISRKGFKVKRFPYCLLCILNLNIDWNNLTPVKIFCSTNLRIQKVCAVQIVKVAGGQPLIIGSAEYVQSLAHKLKIEWKGNTWFIGSKHHRIKLQSSKLRVHISCLLNYKHVY